MPQINIEHHVSPAKLDAMGVDGWPIWRKEVSRFDWHYDNEEICYVLEGEAIVTPNGGKPVTIGQGDLVYFPAGMSCRWEITADIEKHYTFK